MITSASLMSLGCTSKPGPLGEKTIKLDDFDFSTSISEILPERYKKNTEYGDEIYLVPSVSGENVYERDSCRSYSTDEVLWIEYRHGMRSWTDEYLSMAGRTFNAANFATTLDGRIFVVSGFIDELTQAENDDFIAQLSKRYGEPEHTKNSFFIEDYDLYTWTLEDRTLKYAVATTDESNAVKFEVERNEAGELTDIRPGERETHLQSYFFVIAAAWKERFLASGHPRSGDFVFCK